MENLYLGIAAAGIIGFVAYFVLNKARAKKVQITEMTSQAPKSVDKKSPSSTLPSKSKTDSIPTEKPKPVAQIARIKKLEELQSEYEGTYFGSFRLKAANSIHLIIALDFKGSKVLVSTTKNEIDLFNLKNWKKDNKQSTPERYYVSLDNNSASAVCIGERYYYAALTFDKTIVYYEFRGESGVYFKQVAKFQRNILKSNASAIHVSKNQTYIITAGSGADTVIDVWSMKGEKLATMNSFQIQHYSILCGLKSILIRGWTSQVKIVNAIEQKDGAFKKLQKFQHLAHEESPLQSAICNRDMYAVSISKHRKLKLWNLVETGSQRTTEQTEAMTDLKNYTVNKCALYTFEPLVGHFKTVLVVAHSNGFLVTDIHLKTLRKIQGIEVKDMYMNGTQKSVILGTVSSQSQISLWNLTKILDEVEQVKL